MPNLDGTGPQGFGPMRGRRLGRCVAKGSVEEQESRAGSDGPGEIYGLGRGGRPYGGGRGNYFGGGNGRRAMRRGRRFGR